MAQELAGIDQSLAVPAEGAASLPDIQLATGVEAPGIPGARIADRTPAIVGLLAVAAAALLAIAIALAERTRADDGLDRSGCSWWPRSFPRWRAGWCPTWPARGSPRRTMSWRGAWRWS